MKLDLAFRFIIITLKSSTTTTSTTIIMIIKTILRDVNAEPEGISLSRANHIVGKTTLYDMELDRYSSLFIYLCYHYHHNHKLCPSSLVLCTFVVVCKCGKRDSRDVHSCHTLTRLIASLVVIIVVHHCRCFNCYHGCHLYSTLISHFNKIYSISSSKPSMSLAMAYHRCHCY